MNKDELKELVQSAAKEAVAETVNEMEKEVIDGVKAELLSALQNRKELLIQRLTDEIVATNHWGVKARDYLYILLVRIMDRIFEKIEASV